MKTVTCEIPLTGLPDDVARSVVGCEWKRTESGEWRIACCIGVRWYKSKIGCVGEYPTLILRPEPWEGFKALTGAACITRDKDGCCDAWRMIPKAGHSAWVEGGRGKVFSAFRLSDEIASLLKITLPPSTGDWRRDIWLNPDHPANRGEGK